jgi:XRE family transcriptional regulator, regulator of sulfur utilization
MPHNPEKVAKNFGSQLREQRILAGLSQMALAEMAGLNHNYIGEIERAEKQASLDTVIRVANALGLSGADLLGRAGL